MAAILDGVAATVATPPEILNEKSFTVRTPELSLLAYTASEKVTTIVALSLAIVVPVRDQI